MTSVLVLIDIQRDYFPGGSSPLVGPDEAAERAAALLGHFRAQALPVIHVRHESTGADAGFLVAGTPGAEFDSRVAPRPDETVIVKQHPNSFRDTDLRPALDRHAGADLVIAGMMTSMCVDATVRAAADFGYVVTVAADACAAPDLEHNGTQVPGALVHAAYLAALSDGYAKVRPVAEIVADSGN